MQEKIIEAFNETYGNRYKSFEEIKSEYPVTDILDTWLRYEGIIGYTRDISLLQNVNSSDLLLWKGR